MCDQYNVAVKLVLRCPNMVVFNVCISTYTIGGNTSCFRVIHELVVHLVPLVLVGQQLKSKVLFHRFQKYSNALMLNKPGVFWFSISIMYYHMDMSKPVPTCQNHQRFYICLYRILVVHRTNTLILNFLTISVYGKSKLLL